MNKKLKDKILELAHRDQKMRASKKWDLNVDQNNLKEMKEIVKKYGWPGKKLVGEKATIGAWLVVQHGVFDIKFQKYCLKLIKQAYKVKDVPSFTIPFLIDRIRMVQGRSQIYGTQYFKKTREGNLKLRPIENKRKVDERRKKYYLEPLREHKMVDDRIPYKF